MKLKEPVKNTYSEIWFELFLEPIQPIHTEQEIAFLCHYLPTPPYITLLDLCCGQGRHANLLGSRGYKVTGIDLSKTNIDKAKIESNDQVVYFEMDMRNLADMSDSFDAIINLWQSFGYFDDDTNAEILRQIYRKLNPKGRVVLDIYNQNFFKQHQGTRHFEKCGLTITETKSMSDNRLTVLLDYGIGNKLDIFEWQLYTPDKICLLAEKIGFVCILVCANFDKTTPSSSDNPRMQIVLEK